jgi:hypothetical protein
MQAIYLECCELPPSPAAFSCNQALSWHHALHSFEQARHQLAAALHPSAIVGPRLPEGAGRSGKRRSASCHTWHAGM